MKKTIFTLALGICTLTGFSQEYKFKSVVDLDASSVKSQGQTGTCWSFSTSSFLESEIKRITKEDIDISEMYNVRNTYPKKAWNYLMRQGNARFSQGGLAHDVIHAVAQHGIVPEHAFTGLTQNTKAHNHKEVVTVLKAMLDTYITNPAKSLSPRWKNAIESVLDVYLGEKPSAFNYQGVQYTPQSFLEKTKINPAEYITITSFTHQENYKPFILNVPDNFSNGSLYNLPLEQYMQEINHALKKGYTLALDTDVSEDVFSEKHGVAIIPANRKDNKKALTQIVAEKEITAAYRQQEFENFNTTDDHLMHITGMLKDQKGTIYYKVKNSWGSDSSRVGNGGYIYISEAFMRLKSISVLLHKDGLSKKTRKNLGL